jgi:hypothetical protein
MFAFIFLTVMVRTLFVVILPPFPLSSLLNYLLLTVHTSFTTMTKLLYSIHESVIFYHGFLLLCFLTFTL